MAMSLDLPPAPDKVKVKRALLSVSDKTGIVEFGQFLASQGVEVLSTGGTRKALMDAGVNAIEVAEVTGSPEMLDGRVKTLHPRIHGGLLGVVVAIALYARRINVSVFALWDFIAPLAPIGLGLGRLGNFIGQELWGRQTDSMFGMIFPNDPSQLPRHPSQLYQFALEGVLLFLILFFYTRRQRPALAPGALFLFCYGCFRFIVEFVREPDSHIGFDALGWMTRGQLLSLPMILLGAGIFVYAYRRAAAQGK